jgi:hypothetical protein
MSHLEPSYLRYIYDGLEKGDLHPDNAAALPVGLIGLYDDAFDESKPARERQKLLETFAIWALLKKEVSAQFVAEILEVPTQEIIDFIATYSSWFTSPESGKYQLYHERLKVYLLQKLSEQEIAKLYNKLVTRLEQALAEQKEDEFEIYGLEFLSLHYLTSAMLTGEGTKLIALSYNQKHWQRQLKFSKGFEWTKKGLKQVMNWASKYNDEEVIECGLQMVDLHHQEQNDAPQIVALVADGYIDTALKRIEFFGGNDKEGLERKFILYMLCLMELTLLVSKDKPFRNEAIEKILKHFDENMPIDHSILNWDDFFPSYLMFQFALELAKLKIDFLTLYIRTDTWNNDWISKNGPYKVLQIEVLKTSALSIAIECDKYSTMATITTELFKQDWFEQAESIINEILDGARSIINKQDKSITLVNISKELSLQNKSIISHTILQESIDNSNNISDELEKFYVLTLISEELAKQAHLQQSIKLSEVITNDYWKCKALLSISTELAKQGHIENAESALNKAIKIAYSINDEWEKNQAISNIPSELLKQGYLDKALECAQNINEEWEQNNSLSDIVSLLTERGQLDEATKCAQKITIRYWKLRAFSNLSTEFAKQGKLKDALEFAEKSSIHLNISSELVRKRQFKKASSFIQKALVRNRSNISYYNKNKTLSSIFIELSKKNQLKKVLVCTKHITERDLISETLSSIAIEMVKINRIKNSLKLARSLNDLYWKSITLGKLSSELANQQKLEEADSLMQEALEVAYSINDSFYKSSAIEKISIILAKHGKIDEALKCSEFISDVFMKSGAIACICGAIAKYRDLEEANKLALLISDDYSKCKALTSIYTCLIKQNKLELATSTINQAIDIACSISDDFVKGSTLSEISVKLSIQGNWLLAESTIFEIPRLEEKANCCKKIAQKMYKELGWDKSLRQCSNFQNKVLQTYYLKGLAENVRLKEYNIQNVNNAYRYYKEDIDSLQLVFQQYAIYEVFFGGVSMNKLNRFNRTLNIQWAIDIKNQLPY